MNYNDQNFKSSIKKQQEQVNQRKYHKKLQSSHINPEWWAENHEREMEKKKSEIEMEKKWWWAGLHRKRICKR